MERAQEGIRGEEAETANTDSSPFLSKNLPLTLLQMFPFPSPPLCPPPPSLQTALLGPFTAEGMRKRRQELEEEQD